MSSTVRPRLTGRWAACTALLVLSRPPPVRSHVRRSPQTTAQCGTQFNWMFNSLGQSPCMVAAYLQGACFDDESWTVYALAPGEIYIAPDQGSVNACQCNTVTYNALSGCAACQSRNWIDFSTWTQSCPAGSVESKYPDTISNATDVPAWVLADTSGGTFDLSDAIRVASNGTKTLATSPSGLPIGVVVASVLGGCVLLSIPVMLLLLRYTGVKKQGIERVNPARLRTLLLGDGSHQYVAIQKRPLKTPFLSFLFRHHRVSSAQPDADFTIEPEAVMDIRVEAEKEDMQQPEQSGHRKIPSQWRNRDAQTPRSKDERLQQEDLGSALDFTFISSEDGQSSNGRAPPMAQIDAYMLAQAQAQAQAQTQAQTQSAQAVSNSPRPLPKKSSAPDLTTAASQSTLPPLSLSNQGLRHRSSSQDLNTTDRSSTPDQMPTPRLPQHHSSSSSLKNAYIQSAPPHVSMINIPPPRRSSTQEDLETPYAQSAPPQQARFRPPPRRSSDHDLRAGPPAMSIISRAPPRRSSTQELAAHSRSESTSALLQPGSAIDDQQWREQQVARRREAERKTSFGELSILESPPMLEAGAIDDGLESEDSLSHRDYSPPIHRSRLQQIPTNSMEMLYPATVRGTLRRKSGR